MGFILTVTLARVLEAEQFGVYVLLFSAATIIFTPLSNGFNPLIVRETAASIHISLARVFVLFGISISIISFFLIVISIVISSIEPSWLREGMAPTHALLAAILLAVIAINNQLSGLLQGMKHIVVSDLVSRLLRQGIFILFLLFYAFVLTNGATVFNAVLFHIGASITAGIFGVYFLLRQLRGRLQVSAPATLPIKDWSTSFGWMSLIASSQVVMQLSPIIMLGAWATESDVGIFRVCAQTAMLLLLGLQSVNAFMSPRFASAYTEGRMNDLQYLAKWASAVGVTVAFPPAIMSLFFGQRFLVFTFGSDFSEGAFALVILMVGQCVNAAFGPVAVILKMVRQERLALYGLFGGCSCTLGFGSFLIPDSGLIGAAYATTIGVIVWNLALWIFTYKTTGIDASVVALLHRDRDCKD